MLNRYRVEAYLAIRGQEFLKQQQGGGPGGIADANVVEQFAPGAGMSSTAEAGHPSVKPGGAIGRK
jgi:hypothetical protein